MCSNFALPKRYGKWRLLLPLRSQQKLSSALAHPSPHQLHAALVPRFYQFFTLRDGPLMSCFHMKTACFELLPRLYLQYSLGISHYESYWSPSLSLMEGFLKGSAMVHFSPIVYEWGRYLHLALRPNYRLLHHFSKFLYMCFTNVVKNEAGNGCGTSHIARRSSIAVILTSPKLPIIFALKYSTMKQDPILIQ